MDFNPLQPSGNEDLLATLGLHPAQMAAAHAISNGIIEPGDVLAAHAEQPATSPEANPKPLIASPSAGPSLPPIGSTADLENRAMQPHELGPKVPSKLDTDTQELQRLQTTGPGVAQIHSKPARILARIADAAVGSLFPGVAVNIPGTTAHHGAMIQNAERAIAGDQLAEKEQATNEETAARTRELNAEAEAKLNPQAKPKEENWAEFPNFTDADGTPLIREQNSGQVVRANDKKPPTGFKPIDKSQKPDSIDQQYTEALFGGDIAKAERLLQIKRDLAKAGQAPEREPHQLGVVNGRVVELRPGMEVPAGTQTLTGELKGPTADEQRRADLATNMDENLNQLEDILKRRPDLFGPVAGRITGIKGMIGTGDADVAALKTIEEQMGMAMVGAHAMRNAQHVETAANALVNALHNKPEAIEGAISAARKSLNTFKQDVERKTGGGKPAENTTEKKAGFSVPADAPPAPKEDGHKLKANGKVLAVSKGGQWVAPQ